MRKVKKEEIALNTINYQLTNYSSKNQYITFLINDELYGIDILLVQEIIRYTKPTQVYNSNPMIRGLLNFRGKIIPIIDMHRKFNLPEVNYDKYTVVIVFEVDNKTMGIIVDRVSDIMSFEEEDIQMVDKEFAEDIRTEHIKGIAKNGDELVLLLDSLRVISFKELNEINELSDEDAVKNESI